MSLKFTDNEVDVHTDSAVAVLANTSQGNNSPAYVNLPDTLKIPEPKGGNTPHWDEQKLVIFDQIKMK